MNIVFLTHPDFLGSQSMPRYADWLAEGMRIRGHVVTLWRPRPICYRWPVPASLKKWMGYIDQYVLFPWWLKKKTQHQSHDTLYVLTDHALGPWVPQLSKYPHVIHCHDFLAQRSAKGEFPENPISKTGKLYQAYIRYGYRKGKNFISVSQKTQRDLHRFLRLKPVRSQVVYNGLSRNFTQLIEKNLIKQRLSTQFKINLRNGFILHVGGNQWYKNRVGAIEIYSAWRKISSSALPLILVGEPPDLRIQKAYRAANCEEDIHFLTGITDRLVQDLYACASVLLFPSLAEGFGWPIIEAMASGCPVITTDAAPMNEVGGEAARYIALRPNTGDNKSIEEWKVSSAYVLNELLAKSAPERSGIIAAGINNASRFHAESALNAIEKYYAEIVKDSLT